MRQEGEHANIRSIIYLDQRHEWRPRLAVEIPVKLAAQPSAIHTTDTHLDDQSINVIKQEANGSRPIIHQPL